MGRIQGFYNRPCYDDFISLLSDKNRVLIKRTSGIGKTLFLQRVLIHLVRSAKLEGRVIPSVHYMRYRNAEWEVISLLPDGSVHDITHNARERHALPSIYCPIA